MYFDVLNDSYALNSFLLLADTKLNQ